MGQDQGRRRAFRRTIPAQFRFIRRAAGSEGTLIRVNMLAMGFHHPSLRCKPVASWPPGNGRRSTLPKTVDGSPYMNTATSTAYNYKVVRQFAIMTVVWGIVGMLVGVLIAAQLAWPARSEEHTSELQSRPHLVCRLLLEKKKLLISQLAPGWHPHASGAVHGLTLDTTALYLRQAALEGVAFRFAEILDMMPELKAREAKG